VAAAILFFMQQRYDQKQTSNRSNGILVLSMKNFFSKIKKHVKPLVIFLIAVQAVGGFKVAPALALSIQTSAAQAQIDSDTQQIAALNQQISQYKAELAKAGADKKTLQAAISTLNLQSSEVQAKVTLTKKQIDATQLQIQELGTQIQGMQQTVATNQGALASYLRDVQQADNQSLLLQLVASSSLSDFWENLDSTIQVQGAVLVKTQELQTEESTLASAQSAVQQKNTSLSTQNTSLAAQQKSLTATAQSKSQLLAQTKGKESTYQKLLAQAEAQLQSFSKFTQHGGDQLLANQTVCDSWGCYYNQRDAAWGNDALDGTSYTMAGDGCLVTAMAMVMTHYGYKNVTPATINSDPTNFAAYYPAYLLTTISTGGASATRVASTIDATLATGNPVVIGMNVYGGTHFVVLVSGSNGSYAMRDPYVPNGKDINFSSYYSLREIYSIAKVVVGS
jgi:peptidoglycan hydrolase CwlO-like protein